MNYRNGRAVAVGDGVITPVAQAGVVCRLHEETAELEFLTVTERKAGEPYNLIPVTVAGRHWEPTGVRVRASQCVHAGDAIGLIAGPTRAAADPNQGELLAEGTEPAKTEEEEEEEKDSKTGPAKAGTPSSARETGPAEGQSLTGQTPNSARKEEEEKEEEEEKGK